MKFYCNKSENGCGKKCVKQCKRCSDSGWIPVGKYRDLRPAKRNKGK